MVAIKPTYDIVFGLLYVAIALTYWIISIDLYPLVMQDELVFQREAFFLEVSESRYSAYIFQLIFQVSAVFGTNFYEVAKLLNAFILVLTACVVWLGLRKIIGSLRSGLAGAGVVFLPSSQYVSVFMPDLLFVFCLISSFIFFLRSLSSRSELVNLLTAGIFAGLATFIKPHALVFLVGASIWMLLRKRQGLAFLAFTTGFIAVRLIGFVFIGANALNPFGNSYFSVFSNLRGVTSSLTASVTGVIGFVDGGEDVLVVQILQNLLELAAPVALLAMPLVVFIYATMDRTFIGPAALSLVLYVFLPAVVTVAFFEVYASTAAGEQLLGHALFRHLEPYIAMLMITLVSFGKTANLARYPKLSRSALVLVPISIFSAVLMQTLSSSFADSSYLFGLLENPVILWSLCLLFVGYLVFGELNRLRIQQNLAFIWLLLLPILTVVSWGTNYSYNSSPSIYDFVAIRALELSDDDDSVAFIGMDEKLLQAAVFKVAREDTNYEWVGNQTSEIDIRDYDLIVEVGDTEIDRLRKLDLIETGDGYRIYTRSDDAIR